MTMGVAPRVGKLRGRVASEIEPESVSWLWPGWLALGKITIVDGDPGVGKSTLTCDIAGALTSRRELSGGFRFHEAVGVVLVNAEDNASDVVRPRLEAAGADLSRCVIVDHEDGRVILPDHLDQLSREVDRVSARLVVIDPLFAHLPSGKNSWNDQHMREVLAPLKTWAEHIGVAVLLVRHPNKGKDTKALYRGGGSIGIIGAARFGMFVGQHPTETDWRVLTSSKCNIGPKPKSLGFEMIPWALDPLTPQIEWHGETAVSANDLVGYSDGRKTSAIEDAETFLVKLLAAGPLESEEVYERTKQAGISKRTLHRAKDILGIKPRPRLNGGDKHWYWSLPTEPDYSTNGVATDVPF